MSWQYFTLLYIIVITLILQETHCYCTRDLEKGRLKGTCELITSISFENDVIGTYTHENIDKNFHLAMYKLLYDIPKIKGFKNIFTWWYEFSSICSFLYSVYFNCRQFRRMSGKYFYWPFDLPMRLIWYVISLTLVKFSR